MAIHNPKSNNDFNSINKDTMLLDIRVKPKYDNEEIMPLDARIKYEHDNMESSSCHSRAQTRESRAKTCFMPQAFRFAESGRSMVEMLGVLAVIGVLSIGGIAGYSYGMDKYRANETTNQIMLRAIDLMTQAAQGNKTLSLAGWAGEQTQYDFGTPEYIDDGLIIFDVGTQNKLPKRICEIVYDAMKDMAVQIDINATRADSNDTCGDDNEMTFYFEGGSTETANTGPTGEQCGDTVCDTCQKCDSTTKTCITVANYEMKCTTNDNKTGWCVSGTCEPETCNCKEGQYCSDNCSSFEVPVPSNLCITPIFGEINIDGTIYYIPQSAIYWWDAMSACKAIGRNLLTIEEIMAVRETLCETFHGNTDIQFWSSNWKDSITSYIVQPCTGHIGYAPHCMNSNFAICK